MKIRTGFVSNSSSSSFIIALTRDHIFSPEIKQKIYDSYMDYCEEEIIMSMEQFDNILKAGLNELCKGDGFISDEDADPIVLAIVGEIDRIESIDVGPDEGSTTNILADDRIEKTKKTITNNFRNG